MADSQAIAAVTEPLSTIPKSETNSPLNIVRLLEAKGMRRGSQSDKDRRKATAILYGMNLEADEYERAIMAVVEYLEV